MGKPYVQTRESDNIRKKIEELQKPNAEIKRLWDSRFDKVPQRDVRESDCLKRIRKKYSYGDRTISIDIIAKNIGLSPSYLKKQVAKNEPISRDCIIAICVFLKTAIQDANVLLKHYKYAYLDQKDERDSIIMSYLNNDLSVQTLSDHLSNRGFQPLDLNLQDKRIPHNQVNDTPRYEVIRTQVRPLEWPGKENIYDSLMSEYYPDYICVGDMLLKDVQENTYYILSMTSTDRYWCTERPSEDILPIHFDSLDDTGEFKDFFIELKVLVLTEKQRREAILNDTKNYRQRIGANLLDDSIHIFIEAFNYSIPEWNEYYFVELVNGEYRYSVYNESNFMQCYLSSEEYRNIYPFCSPVPVATFSSIEEIEAREEKAKYDRKKYSVSLFKRLQLEVDKCWQDLKDKKAFVQNLYEIYEDNYDDIFRGYGIREEFDCRPIDEFPGCLRINKQEATFNLKTIGKVTIQAQDVYRAFELGFQDIEQICRVKKKKGSIEAVLEK